MRPAAPCAGRGSSRCRGMNGLAAAAVAMRIMVRTLRGERVALDVDGATTVAQVKGMLMAREGVAADAQRLCFAGRHLDDDGLPVAHYGVQHGSVVFLGLRLRADAEHVQMQQQQPAVATTTVKQLIDQQQQLMRFEDLDDDEHGGGEGTVVERKPVSRRALRKILSRLHVDVWTRQHDAKLLDLLHRPTRGRGGRGVGDLTADDWAAIRAELNAATRSAFPVEELQRRLAGLRREFDAVGRIKDHPRFSYDARRRVVVTTEADWKRYVLENPDAVAFERRSPHLGRLRAVFSGGGAETRGDGGAKCRESRAKRCFSKLLRSFGLRCKI